MLRALGFFRCCYMSVLMLSIYALVLPSAVCARQPTIFDHSSLQLLTDRALNDDAPAQSPTIATAEPGTDTDDMLDEGTPPTAEDLPTGESFFSPIAPDSGLTAPILEDDGTAMLFMKAPEKEYREHYNWGDDGRIGRQGWGWVEQPAAGSPWYTFQVGGSKDGIKLAPTGGGKTYVNNEKPGMKDPNAPGALVIYNTPGTTRIQETVFSNLTLLSDSHCQGLRAAMYGRDSMGREVKYDKSLNPDGLKTASSFTFKDLERTVNTAQVWLWTQPCARGPVVIPTPNKSFGQVERVDITLTDIDLPQLRVSDNLRDLKNIWLNETGVIPGFVRAVDSGSGIQKITRVLNGASRRIVLPRHSVACDELHRAQTENPATCPFDRTFPTTLPLAATQDGVNELVLTAYDRSGHQSSPTRIQINVDRKAPTARFASQTINDLTDGWHGGNEDNIRTQLELEDQDSGVQSVRVLTQVRGKKVVLAQREFCTKRLKTASCPHQVQPAFTLQADELIDGEHQLTVEVTDSAGNSHRSNPLRYQHDHIPPNPPASITASLKNRTNANLSWLQARDPLPGSGIDHYRYRLINHGWQETRTLSHSFENLLSKQPYTFELQAVDKAGNGSEVVRKEWVTGVKNQLKNPFCGPDNVKKCCPTTQQACRPPTVIYCKGKGCKNERKKKKPSKKRDEYRDECDQYMQNLTGSYQTALNAIVFANNLDLYYKRQNDAVKKAEAYLRAAERYRDAGSSQERASAAKNYDKKAKDYAHYMQTYYWPVYRSKIHARYTTYPDARGKGNDALKVLKGSHARAICRKAGKGYAQQRTNVLQWAGIVVHGYRDSKYNLNGLDKEKKIFDTYTEGRLVAGDREIADLDHAAAEARQLGLMKTEDALALVYQPILVLSANEDFWPVSFDDAVSRYEHDNNDSCFAFQTSGCVKDIFQPVPLDPQNEITNIEYPAPNNEKGAQASMLQRAVYRRYGKPRTYYFKSLQGRKRQSDPENYIALEYWWYYTYNFVRSGVGKVGRHEGDFEHVTLIFSRDEGKLRFIFLPKHNSDEYKRQSGPFIFTTDWYVGLKKGLCDKSTTDEGNSICFEGNHPVVYSAEGSHATYHKCGTFHRKGIPPDDHTCVGGRYRFWPEKSPLINLTRTSWACWKGLAGGYGPYSKELPVLGAPDSMGPKMPLQQQSEYYASSDPCAELVRNPDQPRMLIQPPKEAGGMSGRNRSLLHSQRKITNATEREYPLESADLENEVADESVVSSELVKQAERNGVNYAQWFDECSDWYDAPEGSLKIVACDQHKLDQFIDSGLENTLLDNIKLTAGEETRPSDSSLRGERKTSLSEQQQRQMLSESGGIPDVIELDEKTANQPVLLTADGAARVAIHASKSTANGTLASTFSSVSLQEDKATSKLLIDTTDDSSWKLETPAGKIVEERVPQLVNSASDESDFQSTEEQTSTSEHKRKGVRVTLQKAYCKEGAFHVSWKVQRRVLRSARFEVRIYANEKSKTYFVAKRMDYQKGKNQYRAKVGKCVRSKKAARVATYTSDGTSLSNAVKIEGSR